MMASCNTLMQTLVDDDKRGRVMSFYVMSFMGLAPFGSLSFGSLAGVIGAPVTLLIGGILGLAGCGVFAWKFIPQEAQLYQRYMNRAVVSETEIIEE